MSLAVSVARPLLSLLELTLLQKDLKDGRNIRGMVVYTDTDRT